MNDETQTMDDVLNTETGAPSAGVPNPAAAPKTEVSAETVATPQTDTHPDILNVTPTFLRGADETVEVDDKFNLKYVLKNGKEMQISVLKPNLDVSTQISDMQVKITEDEAGNRFMQVNNSGVYKLIMGSLIKVILVNGKPLHSVSFDQLSKIGVTKGELDDVMSIIITFYLSE